MKHFITQNKIRKICIILFWLLLWQIMSFGIPKLLFASPIEVIKSLYELIKQSDFWKAILNSFFKVGIGYFLAVFLGSLFGFFAFRVPFFQELCSPILQMMKAMPVASFIIVALIWISSAKISILISFLVAFPIHYINMLEGLKALDKKLEEMAEVFCVPKKRRIKQLYFPQLFPYISSGLKVSAGMCWKAGIAGEIIGLPKYSIGENLYLAKLYLNTADLFAWTAVIILLSIIFEKMWIKVLKWMEEYFIRGKKKNEGIIRIKTGHKGI